MTVVEATILWCKGNRNPEVCTIMSQQTSSNSAILIEEISRLRQVYEQDIAEMNQRLIERTAAYEKREVSMLHEIHSFKVNNRYQRGYHDGERSLHRSLRELAHALIGEGWTLDELAVAHPLAHQLLVAEAKQAAALAGPPPVHITQ
jgi:hypothetical protein